MTTGFQSQPAPENAALAWVSDVDRAALLPQAQRGARLLRMGYIVPRVVIPLILVGSLVTVFEGLQQHAWFERNLWGLSFLDRGYSSLKACKVELYEYVLGRRGEILSSAAKHAELAHEDFRDAKRRFDSPEVLALVKRGEDAFRKTVEQQLIEARADARSHGDEVARAKLKTKLLSSPDEVSEPLIQAHFLAASDMMWNGKQFREQLQKANAVPGVVALLASFLFLLFWLSRAYVRQRKRNEQALRSSEAQVKFLIDNIHDGLAIVDAEGEIEGTNRGLLEMLGAEDESELVGKPLSRVLGADIEPVLDALEGSPMTIVEEREATRIGGTRFPAEVAMREVRTMEGASRVVSLRDLSQKKALELWKREMVAIVSHDLRTPLTSMRGALGIVATGALGAVSAAGQVKLQNATDNVMKMIGLINDLLDLEKLEASAEAPPLVAVDLAAVEERVRESLSAKAQAKDVSVVVKALSDLQVEADANLLEKLLWHLLDNAIKFSSRGARVEISAEPVGSWIEVKVRDQGRGIPAEHIDTVFLRMKQVNPADRAEGSGLGLALARAIAHSLGGVIGLDSKAGEGTTAWVLLKPASAQLVSASPLEVATKVL